MPRSNYRGYSGRRSYTRRAYKSMPSSSSIKRRSIISTRRGLTQNDIASTLISGSVQQWKISLGIFEKSYQIFSIWEALATSPMFKTLQNCYDQVKINGVKVKFSLLNASTAMTGTNCPSFATILDRNGLSSSQYKPGTTDYTDGSALEWEWETYSSYSSFTKTSMSTGSAFNRTLTFYPSTAAEKTMYVSCDQVYPSTLGGSVNTELTSPLSDPSLPFKPIIIGGIYAAPQESTQTYIFSVDYEVNASFRGMHASVGLRSPGTSTPISLIRLDPQEATMESRMISGYNLKTINTSDGSTINLESTQFIVIFEQHDDFTKIYFNASGNPRNVTPPYGTKYIVQTSDYSNLWFSDKLNDPVLFSMSDTPGDNVPTILNVRKNLITFPWW